MNRSTIHSGGRRNDTVIWTLTFEDMHLRIFTHFISLPNVDGI
jgi:hypothetical protein